MRSITELDGQTRVVGVMGWPVGHSLSPPMQNAALAELGLNWVYVPFAVAPEAVPAALEGVRALGIVGVNVTVPHKESVARLVDEREETAQVLGVVNTVCNIEGRLLGFSTDGEGFIRALAENGETLLGRTVALIGAGGAARSVAYALARQGVPELRIINRTLTRAQEVVRLVLEHSDCRATAIGLDAPEAEDAVRGADIVINGTSWGMYPKWDVPPVVPAEWLHEGQCVCDLVYNPQETTLLKAARSRNARTLDGTGMLVHQGAIALERWTGRRAPVATMRRALLGALRARQEMERA